MSQVSVTIMNNLSVGYPRVDAEVPAEGVCGPGRLYELLGESQSNQILCTP